VLAGGQTVLALAEKQAHEAGGRGGVPIARGWGWVVAWFIALVIGAAYHYCMRIQ